MAAWETEKGITVTDAPPAFNAGVRLNDNFSRLRDEVPFNSSSDPTTSDDSHAGFFAGSQWFNTSSQVMWVCTDATADAAEWRSLYQRTADTVILAPESGIGAGSDDRAVILGGNNNTASEANSVAHGDTCTAAAVQSCAGGKQSKAHLQNQWARSSGGASGQLGTAQTTITQLFRRTTNEALFILTLDGNSPDSTNRFVILDGQTLSCFINVVAREENGGANAHASFMRQVCIRREGTTTALVGSQQTIGVDVNPSNWTLNVREDDTNDALEIEVSPGVENNITVRWMATVIASEVADAAI